MNTPVRPLIPVIMIVIAMMSVQTGASLAKSLFPIVGAEGTTTLRLVFAAVLMACVLKPWRAKLDKKSLGTLLIYGVALGAMNLCFYLSIQTLPLGIAVALEFTGPLAVAVFSSRRVIDFMWVALAVLGLSVLIPLRPSDSALNLTGVFFALAAGACWAIYILFGQKAGADNGLRTASLGVTIAAVVVMPFGLWHAGATLFSLSLIPVALAMAVLSSALPFTLEMFALTRLPARTFGTLMSMEPAFGAFSGLIFLQEHLSFNQWLAIGAIIAASSGATLTARSDAKKVAVLPAE